MAGAKRGMRVGGFRGAALALSAALILVSVMGASATAAAIVDVDAPASEDVGLTPATPQTDPSSGPAPEPGDSPSTIPAPSETPTPTPSVTPTPTPSVTPAPEQREQSAQPDSSEARALVQALAVPVPNTPRVATGTDPYVASVNASRALFPGGAETVILTSASYPIFAASAAPLAAEAQAAMLYTLPTTIPVAVMDELRRLAPSVVIVIGGPAFVADSVIAAARTAAADVRRVGGASVYETSRLLFAASTAAADTAYLAGAGTMFDAPIAAPLAAAAGKRMLMVDGNAAPTAATIDALRAAGTTSVVIVRGSAMNSAYEAGMVAAGFAVSTISHADRYALAAIAARTIAVQRSASVIVNSSLAHDVGVAAVVAAVSKQPLYYSLWECLSDIASADIAAAGAPLLLVGDAVALSAAVAANSNCSMEKPRRQNALNSAIRATMGSYPGVFSVTVRELGGVGEITQIDGGVRREPASMMKIFAAWAVFKRVEQGRVTLNSTLASGVSLGTCVQIMIHVSDNYCHADIVHWIGIPELNRMIREAGFTNTVYGSVPRGASVLYAGNRTTTNDLAWMMERLANRTVLSKQYADQLIMLMRSQIWKSRIASGIPPGTPQASKPGAIWLASGLLQADTAIVNGRRYSYIVSIIGDDGPPQEALRAISRTVYSHFNGSFGAAATYPAQQMITRTASALRVSPSGSIVSTIPVGTPIQVLDAQRTWYQVQWGSRKLWVYYTGLRNR